MPLYEVEKQGAPVGDAQAGIAFTTTRLAAGAAVRDMVVDAWRASGEVGVDYPMVSVRDIETGKYVLSRDDFGRD